MDEKLRGTLQDEAQFELLMEWMYREFSSENMLSFIEYNQFKAVLKGYGMIRFPLPLADILRIKLASSQSVPVKTNLTDQIVWRIAASGWKAKNPDWKSFVGSTFAKCRTEVEMKGFERLVRATLILYGPGTMIDSKEA